MSAFVIESFAGEYRFLSNFYPSPIRVGKTLYPTVEHAFQAAKTLNPAEKQEIAEARSPARAKALGRKVKLRKDWESVKVGVMKELVELKFCIHADLAERLLETQDAELVEGNTWSDTFWGVCNGHGKNHLGKVLMQVRERLQVEAAAQETA
jgi:ribA/ribD-fused uncharacterized protein